MGGVCAKSSRTSDLIEKKSTTEAIPTVSYLENSEVTEVSTCPHHFSTIVSSRDFTVEKLIGSGGFGKVYSVQHVSTGLNYAMKVLKKERLKQLNQLAHTLNERKILGNSSSPFIVKLHYAFQTPERLFMVMDYAEGGELFAHIRNQGRLSEEITRFYAAEILLGLDWLHQRGIIYRDLKPENVLLDAEGHIKLSDFGLSKLGLSSDRFTFSVCGTPEYMAPEILEGGGHDRAVDYWGFGTLIYEMLAGMPPITHSDRRNRRVILQTIKNSKLAIKSWFSPEASDLISRLLNPKPSKRLTNASKVKAHPFFFGTNWADIESKLQEPPYKPTLATDGGASKHMQFEDFEADDLSEVAASGFALKFDNFTFKESILAQVQPTEPVTSS